MRLGGEQPSAYALEDIVESFLSLKLGVLSEHARHQLVAILVEARKPVQHRVEALVLNTFETQLLKELVLV